MSGQVAVVAVAPVRSDPVLARLEAALRPEFYGEMIRIDPGDPVFARGRCTAAGCERGG